MSQRKRKGGATAKKKPRAKSKATRSKPKKAAPALPAELRVLGGPSATGLEEYVRKEGAWFPPRP